MTRSEILAAYSVDAHGRITSPGKFEGEPLFAPHFWNLGLCGCADKDDGRTFSFCIGKGDPEHTDFPELKRWMGRRRTLRLTEDAFGFVRCL